MRPWAWCRGCLGPLGRGAQAGLCGRCWSGLTPLPEERCPRCAQPHGPGRCEGGPAAWSRGDALWNYRSGRPPLGALLVAAIKAGERGWMTALLDRARRAPLPAFIAGMDLVCWAPTSPWRRWRRGFDLAQAAAALIARRIHRPCRGLLRKPWLAPAQAGRTESARRSLPAGAVRLRRGREPAGAAVLLVDDVWTTGTTLLRCAQALRRGGARDVAVLTLFRALSGDG